MEEQPFGSFEELPPPMQESEPPPSPVFGGLTALQTTVFGAMWIPTVIATVALLIAIASEVERWRIILSVMAMALGWRLGVAGWRALTPRPYWAGFVAGLAGFVLIPCYLWAGLVFYNELEEKHAAREAASVLEEGLGRAGIADEQIFTQSMFGLGGAPAAPDAPAVLASDERSRWDECFDELYVGAGDTSPYEKAVKRARYKTRGLFESDPETLVVQTLTRVCLSHSRTVIDGLHPYFNRAIGNALTSESRKRPKACEFSPQEPSWNPSPPTELDVHAIWCTLSEEEQDILALDLAGFTGPEIAAELGVSAVAARQRLRRARKTFKENWKKRTN